MMTDEPADLAGLRTSTATEDGRVVLAVAGEVDTYSGPALWAAIESALADEPDELVLDLSGVGFLDSSGIGVLLRAVKTQAGRDGRVLARSPTPQVFKVLELTGLLGVFGLVAPKDVAPPVP